MDVERLSLSIRSVKRDMPRCLSPAARNFQLSAASRLVPRSVVVWRTVILTRSIGTDTWPPSGHLRNCHGLTFVFKNGLQFKINEHHCVISDEREARQRCKCSRGRQWASLTNLPFLVMLCIIVNYLAKHEPVTFRNAASPFSQNYNKLPSR